MPQEYWRLTVVLQDSSRIDLVGEEEDFRDVLDKFCSGETFGKLKLAGITDTADRAPLIVAVDFEHVIALTLVKMYG